MIRAPLEKTVVKKIMKYLNSLPMCRCKKYWSSAHGVELDLYGSYYGRAFFIEVKRGASCKPTPHQMAIIEDWRSMGAIAGVAHDVDGVKKLLDISNEV